MIISRQLLVNSPWKFKFNSSLAKFYEVDNNVEDNSVLKQKQLALMNLTMIRKRKRPIAVHKLAKECIIDVIITDLANNANKFPDNAILSFEADNDVLYFCNFVHLLKVGNTSAIHLIRDLFIAEDNYQLFAREMVECPNLHLYLVIVKKIYDREILKHIVYESAKKGNMIRAFAIKNEWSVLEACKMLLLLEYNDVDLKPLLGGIKDLWVIDEFITANLRYWHTPIIQWLNERLNPQLIFEVNELSIIKFYSYKDSFIFAPNSLIWQDEPRKLKSVEELKIYNNILALSPFIIDKKMQIQNTLNYPMYNLFTEKFLVVSLNSTILVADKFSQDLLYKNNKDYFDEWINNLSWFNLMNLTKKLIEKWPRWNTELNIGHVVLECNIKCIFKYFDSLPLLCFNNPTHKHLYEEYCDLLFMSLAHDAYNSFKKVLDHAGSNTFVDRLILQHMLKIFAQYAPNYEISKFK